jgi:dienelactone hydrolase
VPTSRARRLLLIGLLAALGTTACTRTPVTAAPPTATAPPTYEVATRTLDLQDPSRTTDPTPGQSSDETHGRALPTTIWYPSDGTGPFPVVVFGHGVNSLPSAYSDLLSHWAAAGFVVAAPLFPLTNHDVADQVLTDITNQPADVSYVLTQVLGLGTTAGDPLEGRIDSRHIAAAGHSGGAITALGLFTPCCADARFTAAVLLASSLQGFGSDFTTSTVPALFEHGTADDTIPLTDGQQGYQAWPGPKALVELAEATHTSPYSNRPPSANFSTVEATTTDFLRWALDGDDDALTSFRQTLGDLTATRLAGDELPR